MTDTKQPEALRLARQLADFAEQDQSEWPGDMNWIILAASAEMKGQHARTTALEAENRALKEQLDAIGAGGVTGLQIPNYWRRWSAAQVERLYRNSEVARNDTKSLAAFRRVVTLVEEAHFLPPAIAQEGGK